MYASIRRYQAHDVADLSRLVQDEFIPMIRDISGFVSYQLVDGGDGTIASVTVCEDRAGVEESNRRAAEWTSGSGAAQYLDSRADILAGEVTSGS